MDKKFLSKLKVAMKKDSDAIDSILESAGVLANFNEDLLGEYFDYMETFLLELKDWLKTKPQDLLNEIEQGNSCEEEEEDFGVVFNLSGGGDDVFDWPEYLKISIKNTLKVLGNYKFKIKINVDDCYFELPGCY